jgi:TonB family protein
MQARARIVILVLAALISTVSCVSSSRAVRGQVDEWVYPLRLQTALSKTEGDRRTLLEQLLRDYEPNVRIVAAENLAAIKSENSIEPLVASLEDSDVFVRCLAQQRLARIGTPAVTRLLQGVRSGRYPSHLQALALVAMLGYLDISALSSGFQEEILIETRPVRCLDQFCLRRATPPVYPPLAKQARITGRVRVEFTVNNEGHPEDIKASGHPLLVSSAIDAVQKSIFEISDALHNRHALMIDFDLNGSSTEPGRTAFDVVPPNYWRVVARPPILNVDTGRPTLVAADWQKAPTAEH